MTVNKINGFDAPYRSQTFQRQADSLASASGVMAMDGVPSEDIDYFYVPAFSFIQNGLIVQKSEATAVHKPTMEAPYYLTVSAPTSAIVDDLRFQFAKSPLDVSENEVIVLAYDGREFRLYPFLTIAGIYKDTDQANLDFGRKGPRTKLTTSVVGSEYVTEGGLLVDSQGYRQELKSEVSFDIVPQDEDWKRVDRIVYRRPTDDPKRIGLRTFVTGGTFSTSPEARYETESFDSTIPTKNVKVLIASDNTLHIFAARGYGESFMLQHSKYSSDRQTLITSPHDVVEMTNASFDVAIDDSDEFHIVYIEDGNVKWTRADSSAVLVGSIYTIDGQATDCVNPKVTMDPFSNRVYILYETILASSVRQIFLAAREPAGATVFTPKAITEDNTLSTNASIYVTSDYWVYIAWENAIYQKIYFAVYDDVGTLIQTVMEVSDNTTYGVATLSDGATKPIVKVSDNKEVFITFLQSKGGGNGLSAWHDGMATMVDLLSPSEDFTDYSLYVDPGYNGLHLILAQSSQVDYVKLEEGVVSFSISLSSSSTSGLDIVRDLYGSMVHVWSDEEASTYSNYEVGSPISDIGPGSIAGSLGTVVLANNEMAVSAGSVNPKVGDRVQILGSVGNDGEYLIEEIRLATKNSIEDVLVMGLSASFAASEIPAVGVTANFGMPDGNASYFAKSTSETFETAYRYDVLGSDILLCRIVVPSNIILNYIDPDGPGVDMDTFLVYGESVVIDWERTTAGALTISSGLRVLDLVNNDTYVINGNSYAMSENDALFMYLDGVTFTQTLQVVPVYNLPWGDPIQVLGIIKDGEFNPHLLIAAGISQLDSGEQVILGEDLPQQFRSKLGFISEVSIQDYTNNIGFDLDANYPTAIGETNIMAGQNKHFRLFKGHVTWGTVEFDIDDFGIETVGVDASDNLDIAFFTGEEVVTLLGNLNAALNSGNTLKLTDNNDVVWEMVKNGSTTVGIDGGMENVLLQKDYLSITKVGTGSVSDFSTFSGMSNAEYKLKNPHGFHVVGTGSANELTFTLESFLQLPGIPESRNRIAPQAISLPNSDDIAYVLVNRTGTTSQDLTINIGPASSVPLSRNLIVIARRLEESVVIEPNGMRLDPGDEMDICPNLPGRITTLEKKMDFFYENQPREVSYMVPAGAGIAELDVFSLDPALNWDPDNAVRDIEVYVGAARWVQNEDWWKMTPTKVGFSRTVRPGTKVVVWKQGTFSGFAGEGVEGRLDGYDEGVIVSAAISKINFVGKGVTASQPTPNSMDILVKNGRELAKKVQNGTLYTIPAGKPIAWQDDGTVELADASDTSFQDFAGITVEDILPGSFGLAIGFGQVPGAAASLGATAGQAVYLGANPGELSLSMPIGVDVKIVKVGTAEPADGTSGSATSLWVSPELGVDSSNPMIKLMYNDSGSEIPAGRPVSKKSDGSIVPSDSDDPDGQIYIGITKWAIPDGEIGQVYLVGPNIKDALTGMGAFPGQPVFISQSSGYTLDANEFTGDDDSIIRVGYADCSAGVASSTAPDLIMFSDIIATPPSP